LPHDPA
jgi:hypothetical protein